MEMPENFKGGYYNAEFTPKTRHSDNEAGDNFVEELLDFSNDDAMVVDDGLEAVAGGSSTAIVTDMSRNSSFSVSTNETHFTGDTTGGGRSTDGIRFSGELCLPHDDLAELEWLSNFVEESFSNEDPQKLQLIQGMKAGSDASSETHMYQFQPETTRNAPMLRPELSVPGKARSKRSRTAPGNWTSRLLSVSSSPTNGPAISSSSESDTPSINVVKKAAKAMTKRKEGPENLVGGGDGRRCLHCATDKTPQWRTGPLGPKTLCNACGVRYKSGRLVPEYRPAASPTFVLTKHSNSHRKVMELRRQKELQSVQQQHQQFLHHNMMFNMTNCDDYLIHQDIGPGYQSLI